MGKRRLIVLGLILCLPLVATACGTTSTSTGETVADTPTVEVSTQEPPPGEVETVVIAAIHNLDQLDPHDIAGSGMGHLLNMYESLVGFDFNTLEIIPQLAESWTVSNDGLRYVFTLRQGVTFHDGTELNSEAVKLSFERIVALQKVAGWERLNRIVEILTPDEYTVEFVLSEPGPTPFVIDAETVKIVSPTAVRENEQDGDWANAWFNDHVVGTGPYMLEEWNWNERFVLARNDDYWGELPFFERAVILHIAEGSTQALMIEQGDVDIATAVSIESYEDLMAVPGLEVSDAPGLRNVMLRIFMQDGVPTADRNLRRAIAYALNYPLIEAATSGYLRATDGPVPSPLLDGWQPSNLYEYNMEMARHELALSAYPEGGVTIGVGLSPDETGLQNVDVTIAELLQSELQNLGISLELSIVDWTSFYESMMAAKADATLASDLDNLIMPLAMPAMTVDASNYLQILYTCESGFNFIAYCNPDVEALLAASAEATSIEERDELYREAVELIVGDSPDLWLGLVNLRAVIKDDIEGFTINRVYHPFGVEIATLSRK